MAVPSQRLTYTEGEGIKEVKTETVTEITFNEILKSLLGGHKEDRGVFKTAELLVFGRAVTGIDFSAMTPRDGEPNDEVPPTTEASLDPADS